MNELLSAYPEAKEYADLVHSFLWTGCWPALTIVVSCASAIKILRAVFSGL